MPDRPNILLITSDQHRADALGHAGHSCLNTPHLDLLAHQGTRFDNAYVDCPVCIPARTTFITGRRAHENGCCSYSEAFRVDVERRHMLGGLLTAAGYQTELVGKTHWNTEVDCRGGFEHVTWLARLRRQQLIETGRPGMLAGLGYNEPAPSLSPFPPHLHSTNWLADRACDFIETRERADPFALWVSFQDPHPPFIVHEPYYSMFRDADIDDAVTGAWVESDDEPMDIWKMRHIGNKKPMTPAEVRHMRAVYFGMIANMDHQIGRILAQLQYHGDLDDTLILYTSDHGDAMGDHGLIGKRTFLENSAKVPFIIRPPTGTGEVGQVRRDLVEWADILPTLCTAAGADVPDHVTGRDIGPILRGDSLPEHHVHGQIDDAHMYHDGRYKFIYCVDDGRSLTFDTQTDPNDEHNLTGEHSTRLRQLLIDHLAAEQHEHLINGDLLNRQTPRPSITQLRAENQKGMGPTQYMGKAQRDVMWIN
ncbi:MAG: sulfatase-like hydrolase/transferase [Planctomycetota bacterium]